ncbi:MAG: alpha/beta fold hydrolase [Deltaproteobacteria bacterium]
MILHFNGTPLQVLEPALKGTEKEPSLLFVHGAGGSAEIWQDQVGFFEGLHSVFRIDLPGHGGSGRSGEDRIRTYAERVRLCSEKLFAKSPFVLVGHSMGGAIVLDLALDPPPGLRGLVLVGSGAKLAVTHAIFQMLSEDPGAFFRSIDQFAFSLTAPQALRDRFIRMTRQCPLAVIFNDFKACDHFDIRSRLQEIKLPTLVVCGEEDQLTPVKYSRYLHENVAGSCLVLIPGAGHLVMAEQSDLFNRAVLSFLNGLGI